MYAEDNDQNSRNAIILNPQVIAAAQHISSDMPTQLPSTVSKEDRCVVCNIPARGMHFGVNTCAACGAFFRRSVVEQRSYRCLQKANKCTIVHGFAKCKFCRHCRFKKCLAVGMMPEKVQSKVQSKNNVIMLPTIVESQKINYGVNEYVYKYSILQQQRDDCYRAGRPLNKENNFNQAATMGDFLIVANSDPEFVSNYLNTSGALAGLSDCDKMAVFKNFLIISRLTEQAHLTSLQSGVCDGCFLLLDGSFLTASEAGLARFYGSSTSSTGPPVLMDHKFLARMSLPSAEFHVNELISSFKRLNLSDQEFVVLLHLILWDTANADLSLHGQQIVKNKRRQIIKDLCEYYKSTHMDIPIRFANLILLLNPIQENTRMWKEMLRIIALMKADKTTNQCESQSQLRLIDQF